MLLDIIHRVIAHKKLRDNPVSGLGGYRPTASLPITTLRSYRLRFGAERYGIESEIDGLLAELKAQTSAATGARDGFPYAPEQFNYYLLRERVTAIGNTIRAHHDTCVPVFESIYPVGATNLYAKSERYSTLYMQGLAPFFTQYSRGLWTSERHGVFERELGKLRPVIHEFFDLESQLMTLL